MVYVALENAEAAEDRRFYRVEVMVRYEEPLLHAIPRAEDSLFGSDGQRIGRVEEVSELSEQNGHKEFFLVCTLWDGIPVQGESFVLETARSVREGRILTVEETEEEAK